ncbi:MAG: DUF4258 domain-containing protein [Phycisphaerae bacterium]|nr:DUF4258 domain-containing protein [Phycisphaerae bacterium]
MTAASRKALKAVRRCVKAGRFRLALHFTERMDERGLFWPDVLAILDAPADVRDGGPEQWGRPKWIITGQAADGDALELVCVLDTDERGKLTVFVTMY